MADFLSPLAFSVAFRRRILRIAMAHHVLLRNHDKPIKRPDVGCLFWHSGRPDLFKPDFSAPVSPSYRVRICGAAAAKLLCLLSSGRTDRVRPPSPRLCSNKQDGEHGRYTTPRALQAHPYAAVAEERLLPAPRSSP